MPGVAEVPNDLLLSRPGVRCSAKRPRFREEPGARWLPATLAFGTATGQAKGYFAGTGSPSPAAAPT